MAHHIFKVKAEPSKSVIKICQVEVFYLYLRSYKNDKANED